MSGCGEPYATATLYSTRTTVLPTVVVATVSPAATNDDGSSEEQILTTFTSSYTTTALIPTSTLYATPTCASTTASASATGGGAGSRSTSAVVPTGMTSSTKTQTLTSALATVSDAGGRQSVVYVTYTQTLASPQPVYVTTVIPAAAETSAAGSSSSTSNKSTHKGAVIGGVVGGVIALAALFLLVLFCLRKRRHQRGQVSLDELFRRSAGGMRGDRGDDDEEDGRTIAGVSRNNSGASTKAAMAGMEGAGPGVVDIEDEMVEGQIGNGIVPTLGRSASKGATLSPTFPLSISTTAANGSAATGLLARSGSESSKAPTPYNVTPPSGGNSDPSTPYEDPQSPPLADAGIMAFVGGRPASYAGHFGSPPSSPKAATPGGTTVALPPAVWSGSSSHQQPQHYPTLSRPRSVGNMDLHFIPSSRPTSPTYYANGPQQPRSPPLRPTSPPFVAPGGQHRPKLGGPQRSTSPPPNGAMWRSPPLKASSPPSTGNGNPHRTPSGGFARGPDGSARLGKGNRTLSWGSGSMAQLQALTSSTPSSNQQQQQQQEPSFGVQPRGPRHSTQYQPRRQQTASPPPPGTHSADWPPSRYGHLDVAFGAARPAGGSSNGSSAASTPPATSPNPASTPTESAAGLTGSETVRSVDSSRYWKSPVDSTSPPPLPQQQQQQPALAQPVAKHGSATPVEDDEDTSAALAAEKALWGRKLFVTNAEDDP